MTTAADVLAVARSQLGTVGGATYQRAHGVSSGAWCAYFATWVLRTAGVADGPWTGWTPALVTWGRARGCWSGGDGRPGDLALFMWPTVSVVGRGSPPVCHVGVVEAVDRSGIYSIEGNTSGSATGSQHDGNRVARRRRTTNIVGFVHLGGVYGGPAVPADARNADGSLRLAEDGVRGPGTIGRWQEVLGTPVDGRIDAVSPVIRADQVFLNSVVAPAQIADLTRAPALATDGVEGRDTIRVRQFWLCNTQSAALGRAPAASDFDGRAGPTTTRLHQHALNAAVAGSGRY